MPKRSAEEQIKRYERKLRKLNKKVNRLPSESSSDAEHPPDLDSSMVLDLDLDELDAPGPSNPGAEQTQEDPAQTTEPSELDPEMLSALGTDNLETPEFGDNIHEDLAKRWLPILKKGLPKEIKEKLVKEYLVPDNLKLLRAPDLNVELMPALTETVRSRDKKLKSNQQQLGTSITAANKALDILLKNGDNIEAVRHLSNCSRILLDLHAHETKWRRILITMSLEKSFLQIVQDSERDDTLFGSNLIEKIKNSKSSEKLGLHFKKTPPVRTSSQAFNTARSTSQGNCSRPRPSTSRGGRGSQHRTTLAPQRQPPMPRPTHQNVNRGRAPTRR